MSTIEELGARVRAASDELPVALVAAALDRFRLATERLRWVRQESADPMGVPELSAATEHAETANHALLVARQQLAAYLAAIGLGADAPGRADRGAADDRPAAGSAGAPPGPTRARSTPDWWPARVSELTGRTPPPHPEGRPPVTDAEELLRRVARAVRSADRGRLHAELRTAAAEVGLGLATVAPPVLRTLAGQLLGHPPQPQDLPRLRRTLAAGARDLLPGLPAEVLDAVLSRLCRVPPPRNAQAHVNPADPAVAAGVLTGLLVRRLGQDAPPPQRGPSDG